MSDEKEKKALASIIQEFFPETWRTNFIKVGTFSSHLLNIITVAGLGLTFVSSLAYAIAYSFQYVWSFAIPLVLLAPKGILFNIASRYPQTDLRWGTPEYRSVTKKRGIELITLLFSQLILFVGELLTIIISCTAMHSVSEEMRKSLASFILLMGLNLFLSHLLLISAAFHAFASVLVMGIAIFEALNPRITSKKDSDICLSANDPKNPGEKVSEIQ